MLDPIIKFTIYSVAISMTLITSFMYLNRRQYQEAWWFFALAVVVVLVEYIW